MLNVKPVSYFQVDKRWKNLPYRVPGEKATIGDSGCGPTSAAMLIETIAGKKFTPVDACKWSVDHGYKALKAGTYYSYFTPQFKEFGIECWQLSWTNVYHRPKHGVHDRAFDYLKRGYYLIALMKKGTWTTGGHFVVVYGVDETKRKVYINDPASTRSNRVVGNLDTFRNEAAYYWIVDGRSLNVGEAIKEEEDVDQVTFDKMFSTSMEKFLNSHRDNESSEWSRQAREYCVEHGIFSGGGQDDPNFMWEDFLTREQAAVLIYNFAVKHGIVAPKTDS